jgi:hypothetical protein
VPPPNMQLAQGVSLFSWLSHSQRSGDATDIEVQPVRSRWSVLRGGVSEPRRSFTRSTWEFGEWRASRFMYSCGPLLSRLGRYSRGFWRRGGLRGGCSACFILALFFRSHLWPPPARDAEVLCWFVSGRDSGSAWSLSRSRPACQGGHVRISTLARVGYPVPSVEAAYARTTSRTIRVWICVGR